MLLMRVNSLVVSGNSHAVDFVVVASTVAYPTLLYLQVHRVFLRSVRLEPEISAEYLMIALFSWVNQRSCRPVRIYGMRKRRSPTI